MTPYHLLTLKRPARGEEPEKEWGGGRCKSREESASKLKIKSFQMCVVLICVDASEKSSKRRTEWAHLIWPKTKWVLGRVVLADFSRWNSCCSAKRSEWEEHAWLQGKRAGGPWSRVKVLTFFFNGKDLRISYILKRKHQWRELKL